MKSKPWLLVMAAFLVGCASSPKWKVNELSSAIGTIPGRADEDMRRDSERRPAEVLTFLGVEQGDRVLDVLASGGWYSEVLSVAVGPEGLVYAQNPPRLLQFRDGFYEKQLVSRLSGNRLTNVYRLDANFSDLNLAPESIDLALLALNFHDLYYLMGPETAEAALKAIHRVLKPNGVLGLIDHDGHGNNHETNQQTHRISQRVVERLASAAGFSLDAESDVLRNPSDDYSKNVFDPAVKGRTDRFVLRLRK